MIQNKSLDSLNALYKKVDSLQIEIKSLNDSLAVNKLAFRINEKAEILNNIDSFYNSAWTKLIFLITILGIVVPLIIQYFQRVSNKQLFEQYSQKFQRDTKKRIKKTIKKNNHQLEKIKEEYNNEIDNIKTLNKNQINELEANTFYLQGRTRLTEGHYNFALKDFAYSARKYLETTKIKRTKVLLTFVSRSISNFKSDKEFSDFIKEQKFDIELFIAKFCTKSNRETFIEEVSEIRTAINNLE